MQQVSLIGKVQSISPTEKIKRESCTALLKQDFTLSLGERSKIQEIEDIGYVVDKSVFYLMALKF